MKKGVKICQGKNLMIFVNLSFLLSYKIRVAGFEPATFCWDRKTALGVHRMHTSSDLSCMAACIWCIKAMMHSVCLNRPVVTRVN